MNKILFLSLLFSSYFSLDAKLPHCFSLHGELIYFAPSYDETYFVINGTGHDGLDNFTPNGKRINNPVGYNLGFRIQGIYEIYDPYVACSLRWTHVNSRAEKTVSNQDVQLWPTEVVPSLPNVSSPFSGEAKSLVNVMYQKSELLFDEHLWAFFCGSFFLREALEWSYLRYHEKVEYISDIDSEEIVYHAHAKGMGPQLGIIALVYPWQLFGWYPKNLSLRLMTSASLIVANSKAKVKMWDVFSVYNKVTQSSIWKLIPEWTIDIGFEYDNILCTFPLIFKIGYEFTTYINGIPKLFFTEADTPGQSFNHYSDFYVHGIHIGMGISI